MHVLLKKHGLELEKGEKGGYVARAIDSELRVKASSVFRDNFSGKENRAQSAQTGVTQVLEQKRTLSPTWPLTGPPRAGRSSPRAPRRSRRSR